MDIHETDVPYGTLLDTKDACKEDLKNNYVKVGHPIAFSGIQNIYDYYNQQLSKEEIRSVLSGIENYTLHKDFHEGQRNPSYSHFKRYQFQMDLVDIQNLSKYNDGVNYLLTCIDTFTRYAFVRLLQSKHGKVVLNAFKSILEEAVEKPLILIVDRGTEFYNQEFRAFCEANGIKFFSPDSSIHGAYIERFNRSLQTIIYKYMTENETFRFIDRSEKTINEITRKDLMPYFMETYNFRKHRMTGVSPFQAENQPELHPGMRNKLAKYHETIKKKKIVFHIGDTVRVSKIKGKFSRGYNEQASQEIFKIQDIKTSNRIPMYVLSNYRGDEIIKGNFYAFELVKVTGDIFRVETVLRRRTIRGQNQLFVKWKGFDNSYNSWINETDIQQRF